MKNSRQTQIPRGRLLGLPFALLLPLVGGCSPADDGAATPPAPVSEAGETQGAGDSQVETPAPAATPAPTTSGATALGEGVDPANQRKGLGDRYEGGLESKKYDMSALKVDTPASQAAPQATVAPTTANGILPPTAPIQKGKLNLAEGAEQTHDFGTIQQGDMGHHRFELVSSGEEALVISGVKPSCGCTKALIALIAEDGTESEYTPGDPIPVGQKFALETEINTDGKQGPFTAQVSLIGNDPRGAFNLRMVAEIEPVLKVMPAPTVYFGRITTAASVEETVTVTSSTGAPFMLTPRTESVVEPMRLELIPLEPDAEGKAAQWNIKVALGPDIPVGMRNYPLRFDSDIVVPHPKYPSADGSPQYYSVQLNVQAQVTGMVSAEPGFISFGMVNHGSPVERAIQLEVHDDFKLTESMPVRIEGLQGQDFPFADAFSTSITPLDGGKRAELRVILDGMPEDALGSFGGTLKVEVGHPFMNTLSVRFSGISRPAATPNQGG